MAREQLDLQDEAQRRLKLRRELTAEVNAWYARAWRMKRLLASYGTNFRHTGIRTEADAEVSSMAWYRLHEAIYNLNLLKQALIGL